MNPSITARTALVVSILALAVSVLALLLRPKGEPTPPHPFQYFKLSNNSTKDVKSAELKGKNAAGVVYTCSSWLPTVPPAQDYAVQWPSGWSEHIRYLQLDVVFKDDSTASSGWVSYPSPGYCLHRAEWDILANYTIRPTLMVPHAEQD